jgi:hypothetical protein
MSLTLWLPSQFPTRSAYPLALAEQAATRLATSSSPRLGQTSPKPRHAHLLLLLLLRHTRCRRRPLSPRSIHPSSRSPPFPRRAHSRPRASVASPRRSARGVSARPPSRRRRPPPPPRTRARSCERSAPMASSRRRSGSSSPPRSRPTRTPTSRCSASASGAARWNPGCARARTRTTGTRGSGSASGTPCSACSSGSGRRGTLGGYSPKCPSGTSSPGTSWWAGTGRPGCWRRRWTCTTG